MNFNLNPCERSRAPRSLCAAVCALALAAGCAAAGPRGWSEPSITQVADFGWGDRPTGVAVTSSGPDNRIFVSFPRWFANHSAPTAAEVHVDKATGRTKLTPYPDASWNAWTTNSTAAQTKTQFVNVQSVFVEYSSRVHRIALFAARDILPYEELTYDYGYVVGSVEGKTLRCLCGAPSCRGYLF